MKLVKVTGRIFNVERVVSALVYPAQVMVFAEDYHPVTLTGEDAQRMAEALRDAGFIGEDILVNPNRISAAEDAGATMRVFMAGSDRVVSLPRELLAFPALETAATGVAGDKPRRKKGAE